MTLAALLSILGTLAAVIVALIVAFVVKRALSRALLDRYACAAGPVWMLSAAVVALICLVVFVRCLFVTELGIDRCAVGEASRLLAFLVAPAGRLTFPGSALWLVVAVVVLTSLYCLLVMLLTWLIGPPPAGEPSEAAERRRGLPPASAAASTKEPKMGVLTSIAAVAGMMEWIYLHLGYWQDPRPGTEPRFRLWLERLHASLAWLKWLALPAVVMGWGTAVGWVAAALFHDALSRLLELPPLPPEPEEEPEEEPAPEVEPVPIIDEAALVAKLHEELSGAGGCLRPVGLSGGRAPRLGDQPWIAGEDKPLSSRVPGLYAELKGLAGLNLYLHQLEAGRRLRGGKDVLLSTLPGSGRTAVATMLAVDEALCTAGSVLWVVPEAETAKALVEDLRGLGRPEGWHWFISVHDLANDGHAGLDPKEAQPEVVVATADTLEDHLLTVAEDWDFFLANLSLVVVSGVEAHFGPRSAALGGALRRLERRCRAAGGAPRVLATTSGLWQGVRGLAEEVSGRTLSVVDDDLDGAPRPAQAIHAAAGEPDLIDRLRERIEAEGWTCLVQGSEVVSSTRRAPAELPPGAAPKLALIISVGSASLPALGRAAAHYPLGVSHDLRVLVIWVNRPDHPLATALLHPDRTGEPWPGWALGRPALASGIDNRAEAVQTLRRLLAEQEVSREELVEEFGEEIAGNVIEGLTQMEAITRRRSAEPDPATGLPRPIELLRISDPALVRTPSVSEAVTEDPYVLRDGASGEPVLAVDQVRARAALYPGMIVDQGGRRLVVTVEGGRPEAELEPEPVWSVPIRTVALSPLGWSPQPLRLGGPDGLELGLGPVRLEIAVQGLRRFDRRGELLDERRLGDPPAAAYEARAVVLRFPVELEVSPGAVHALAHLVAAALPRAIFAGDLDLDVLLLEPDDRGAFGLALADLHPFGAGFADALGPRSIRPLLRLARDLLAESPRAAAGPICRCPAGAAAPPEAEAAAELLQRVLGERSRP